ncbi:MAG: ABC transporter permease [Opitutae bacterium]|nr:ABC transporter permease [Opitutae bacterium]
MRWLRKIFAYAQRSRLETEMAAEMEHHIELQTELNLKAGMTPAEARAEARRQFGNAASIQERAREVRHWVWLEDFRRDLEQAARSLRQSPGFTATAVVTLALGIGANAAIFSVVNAVLLRPLAYPQPEQLMHLLENNLPRKVTEFSVSYPNYADWKARSRSWAGLCATRDDSVNLLTAGDPERLVALRFTADFPATFGLRPALGRGFLPQEDVKGAAPVAMLSVGLWRRLYHADPEVLGRKLTLDGVPHTVVGVAAPDFGLEREVDIFLPLGPHINERRSYHELAVYGRLRPEVSRDQAAAELAAIARQIEQENGEDSAGWNVSLRPLFDSLVTSDYRRVLGLLFAAVGLLLLIACSNFSSLLLVRASSRTRELAIRTALGGGGGRLLRQLLTESVFLAGLGGGAGSLLAMWAVEFLRTLDSPRAAKITMDGRVLAFACLVSLAAGVLAAAGPAWRATRLDVQRGLKENSAGALGGGRRLRNALIIGQLALSIVLLATAGLMLRTLCHLGRADLGFRPEQVVTMRIAPTHDATGLFTALLERVRDLPGVVALGATSGPPMGGGRTAAHVFPVGPALRPATEALQAEWRVVSADCFKALGVPLLRGRSFSTGDGENAPKVIVVSQAFARLMWGEEDPLGRQVSVGSGKTYSTVVGVVGDVRTHDPATPPEPAFYMSLYRGVPGAMTLVLRTQREAQELVPLVRAQLKGLDPTLPIFEVRSLTDLVSGQLATSRLVAGLLAGFAAVALLLAMVGLYGVMAQATSQRTRETGIRLALGAQRLDVLRPLMAEGARLIMAGSVLGLGLAVVAAQLIRSLLHGIAPTDPLTLAGAMSLLAGIALFACWLPARRTAQVDPLIALRAE